MWISSIEWDEKVLEVFYLLKKHILTFKTNRWGKLFSCFWRRNSIEILHTYFRNNNNEDAISVYCKSFCCKYFHFKTNQIVFPGMNVLIIFLYLFQKIDDFHPICSHLSHCRYEKNKKTLGPNMSAKVLRNLALILKGFLLFCVCKRRKEALYVTI